VTLPGCALVLLLAPHVELGLASAYGWPGDDNGRFACRRILIKRLGLRGWERALARGVAHRSLPCGSTVRLYDLASKRRATATVVDRGPYGALIGKRWVLKRTEEDPGVWRGVLDTLPPTAARLRLSGLDPILLQVVRP
jgi:hypothetical protein